MVLRVYGMTASQPVRSVLWPLLIKDVPHEFVKITPGSKKPGGSRNPSFLKINPIGTVPTIDHDGVVIAESSAILIYLAEKFGWTDLYPSCPAARAKIIEYMSWHQRNTREITIHLFAPLARPDLKLKVTEHGKKVVRNVFKVLDTVFLASTKYVAGNSLSIADFLAYEEISQCEEQYCDLYDLSQYKNVVQWIQRMRTLPGHEKVHNVLVKLGKFFKSNQAKL
eukprot:CAMPEP_0175160374 /NCGR_PEP_ID=MMETSP0087-20121206/23978_1 /TAXON_ID=136419 /ORGANISM="Unknown Unknown, Strain D1" /LENGTH=223 /DNA_ID=CAMNT_0016448599 /DNA_START=13 /DNA_END=684 /DNA_ORIENTATION=-